MKEFNDNNVTDKERLDENFGMSAYLGVGAQQNHNAYKVFYEFLKTNKPKQILEIGTGVGGFTHALQTFISDLELDTHILTYDIFNSGMHDKLNSIGVDSRIENIFNNQYTEVKQEVIDYIQRDGITIVLCDGARKIEEFRLFSQYIKPGDFILAHDYSSNLQYFTDNVDKKIWNWFEIRDSDIEEVSIKYNLSPYMPEVFQAVVWVSKIKSNKE